MRRSFGKDLGKHLGWIAAMVLLGASTQARAEIPFADAITPGELRGIVRTDDTAWPASYWEYLPSDFEDAPEGSLYPMLLTLGGIGTMDNLSVCPGLTDTCTVAECEAAAPLDGLCRVYRRGPAVEIRAGVWDDVERPFIVIQPQNRAPTNSAQDYDRDELDALVQFVVDNYPVDPRRLYILGNSQGGRATYQYLALYARRMAAGTAGPGGVISEADFGCRLEDTPLWAFHGENDEDTNVAAGAFDPCFVARNVSRANQPELYDDVYPTCAQRLERPFPQSRMTMWQNTAHNAWTPAFEDVTQGFGTPAWTADEMCGFETNWVQSDPMEYPDGVYTWLLEHDRPGVNAGGALTVPGDVDTFTIAPEVVDDDAWTATWEQLSGPAVTMTPGMDGSVDITEFQYGTSYSFRVFVVDADNQWAEDTLEVTIEAEVIEGGETSSGSGTSDGDSSGSPGSSGSSGSSGSPDSTSSTGGDSTGSTSGASGTTGGGSTSGSASGSGSGDDGVSASGSASDSGTGEADTDSDSAGQGSSSGGCRVGGEPPLGWMLTLGLLGLRRRRP